MSKLKELIRELCPDGVEYKPLRDVVESFSGMSGVSNKWKESGNCKFIDYLNVYNNLTADVSKLQNATVKNLNQNTLQIGDILLTCASEIPQECAISAVIRNNIDDDVFLDDHLFGIRVKPEFSATICPAFVNYYFCSSQFRTQVCKIVRGVTRFYIIPKSFLNLEIPVPSLEVQEEIVRILDRFTNLAAELQARREQYEYYRDKLLTFDKVSRGGILNVTWMKMSELFDMRNGYTPSKANPMYWENGTIPWFRMEDIRTNGRILSDSIQHITQDAVKGGKLFPSNSFIIATTATIGEHALLIADSLANQQFTNLQVRKSLIDRINIKFLYYYMYIVGMWCRNNTNVSGFASVDMKKFKKLLIPVPSLAEQERIVSILDKFETLVNDLAEGLPAEMAAVQEQYEYYRNKLLSFPRFAAGA